VLGAGLFGIAAARWLPRPGVLPLVAILLILDFLTFYQNTDTDLVHGRAWFELWPVWLASSKGLLPRQPLGQEMWHLAYLFGLGVLAGIAAPARPVRLCAPAAPTTRPGRQTRAARPPSVGQSTCGCQGL
jgi:hypothetical protein